VRTRPVFAQTVTYDITIRLSVVNLYEVLNKINSNKLFYVLISVVHVLYHDHIANHKTCVISHV